MTRSPSSQKTRELWVHISWEGQVWYGLGTVISQFPQAEKDFVDHEAVQTADTVRILGNAANARFIRALADRRQITGRPLRIAVASPSLAYRPSAKATLEQMPRITSPPSAGGWHTLTKKDYVTYAMLDEVIAADGHSSQPLLALAEMHPAWPLVTFSLTFSPEHAAVLLTAIVDPRWHCGGDAEEGKVLKKYLGIGGPAASRRFERMLKGKPNSGDGMEQRAGLVLRAWAGAEPQRNWQEKHGSLQSDPRGFFWRQARLPAGNILPSGMARASKVFVQMLAQVWCDRLTPPRRYLAGDQVPAEWEISREDGRQPVMAPCSRYSPTLFLPENYFSEAERQAWKGHVAAYDLIDWPAA